MADKASIESLTISVGKHKFTLTLAEARELKRVLNDALEPKVTIERPPARSADNTWRDFAPPSRRPMYRDATTMPLPMRSEIIC